MPKNTYRILGLMSGTSLDGLDIAYCTLSKNDDNWQYHIEAADCIKYTAEWCEKLQNAPQLSGYELSLLNKEYGFYLAQCVNNFIRKYNIEPQLIASHGHTIYHDPKKYLSLQIGDGAALYAATQIPAVCDFRSVDVCLDGQGAPLVPIGDKLLFADYDFCLNLGGIANISFDDKDGKRIAFDISPCNLVLNRLAAELGFDFDKNGELAASGDVNQPLFEKLNNWNYYKQHAPKSLDKEQLLQELMPLLQESKISTEDKLATFTIHIALQIAEVINTQKPYMHTSRNALHLLATGGGAFNTFLIKTLQQKTDVQILVPEEKLVNYKEALVFAFLGLLRVLNMNNGLATVTGAKQDSVGGALYGSF